MSGTLEFSTLEEEGDISCPRNLTKQNCWIVATEWPDRVQAVGH